MMKTLFIDMDNTVCLAEVDAERKFAVNEFVRIGDGVYTVYAITHGKEKIVAHVTARFEPPACDVIIDLGRLWTREPPTKPGWYWARRKGDAGKVLGVPTMLRVRSGIAAFSPLIAEHAGVEEVSDLSEHDLWCGPIEAPPLPEGT